MPSRRDEGGVPGWVIAAVPLAAAVGIGAAVLTLFPGPAPGTARPTDSPIPTVSATPGLSFRATRATPAATPHPATRRGMAWSVADGRLYMVGGTSGGLSGSAVVFDGRLWEELPAVREPRTGAALGALSDGTLVLAGGQVDGTSTDSTLVLEPGATEWRPAAPMPHAQSHAAYAVLDGRLYLFGGIEPAHADAMLSFDIATGAWASAEPIPAAVSRASAIAHDGVIYVTGGNGADGAPRAEAFRYDPTAATWTPLSPVPRPVAGHASAVVDGRLWLLGTGAFTPQGFAPIPVYDFAANTWTLVDDTNGNAAGEGVAAMVHPSGDILLIGALGGTSTVRTSP